MAVVAHAGEGWELLREHLLLARDADFISARISPAEAHILVHESVSAGQGQALLTCIRDLLAERCQAMKPALIATATVSPRAFAHSIVEALKGVTALAESWRPALQRLIKSHIQRTLTSSWESEVDAVVRFRCSSRMCARTLAANNTSLLSADRTFRPLQMSATLLSDQEVCASLEATLDYASSQPLAIEPQVLMDLVAQLHRIRPRLLRSAPALQERFLTSVPGYEDTEEMHAITSPAVQIELAAQQIASSATATGRVSQGTAPAEKRRQASESEDESAEELNFGASDAAPSSRVATGRKAARLRQPQHRTPSRYAQQNLEDDRSDPSDRTASSM